LNGDARNREDVNSRRNVSNSKDGSYNSYIILRRDASNSGDCRNYNTSGKRWDVNSSRDANSNSKDSNSRDGSNNSESCKNRGAMQQARVRAPPTPGTSAEKLAIEGN
jgi:hypothetical protein